MNHDPVDYPLVIRYLDASSSEEDRRRAREHMLKNPEARAYLLEVAGQMVHLVDHEAAYAATPCEVSGNITCSLEYQPVTEDAQEEKSVAKQMPPILKYPQRLKFIAGSLMLAVLLFLMFPYIRQADVAAEAEPSLQLSDYLGQLTVNHRHQNYKTPFRDLPPISTGDVIEAHNWLSWAEFKLDSGAILTVPVSSKIHIKSLTKDRMEVDVISGAVRIHAAKDDPFQFVIRSERLQVTTAGSDTLVWDFSFGRALAASFSGSADVTSNDGRLKAHIEHDQMATIGYDDQDFRISGHPEIVHTWTTRGMSPTELGTGIWKEPTQPENVRLLAAPKNYIYADGTSHQLQEVMAAVWRRPGFVRLSGGSRLIVSGRYTKPAPVSFVLRMHSDYGKLLDLFIKTLPPEKLAAPGEPWRVEIPVEEMQSRFKPGRDPIGSLLFNISIHSYEEIGLEVNSIELIAPG